MKQLANKLEEKSVEAEEAQQLCKSLKVDLQQTIQSQTLSSEEGDKIDIPYFLITVGIACILLHNLLFWVVGI